MAKDYDVSSKIDERNLAGKTAESENDLDAAIKAYEENIKENYADSFAFDRLLIIYRKQKKYREELRVLNKGIKLFSQRHATQLTVKKNKKQVADLSNAFMLKSGLKDKKGNHTYFPEPVNKWQKRKALVEKKLEERKP